MVKLYLLIMLILILLKEDPSVLAKRVSAFTSRKREASNSDESIMHHHHHHNNHYGGFDWSFLSNTNLEKLAAMAATTRQTVVQDGASGSTTTMSPALSFIDELGQKIRKKLNLTDSRSTTTTTTTISTTSSTTIPITTSFPPTLIAEIQTDDSTQIISSGSRDDVAISTSELIESIEIPEDSNEPDVPPPVDPSPLPSLAAFSTQDENEQNKTAVPIESSTLATYSSSKILTTLIESTVTTTYSTTQSSSDSTQSVSTTELVRPTTTTSQDEQSKKKSPDSSSDKASIPVIVPSSASTSFSSVMFKTLSLLSISISLFMI